MILDDGATVLRGGVPSAERWLNSVLDAMDETGVPVLSVHGHNRMSGETLESLIHRIASEADYPNKQIAATTAGSIRKLGLSLEHDPSDGQSPCHFHIVFSEEPNMLSVESLIRVFGDPIPNPTGGKVRTK